MATYYNIFPRTSITCCKFRNFITFLNNEWVRAKWIKLILSRLDIFLFPCPSFRLTWISYFCILLATIYDKIKEGTLSIMSFYYYVCYVYLPSIKSIYLALQKITLGTGTNTIRKMKSLQHILIIIVKIPMTIKQDMGEHYNNEWFFAKINL